MSAVSSLPVIMLRVEDVERVAAFYRDGLNLEVVNHNPGRLAQMLLPGWSILEIGMGGKPLALPADRSESPSTLIFETTDIESLTDRLVGLGGTVVNPLLELTGFRMSYLADPEGHLVGLTTGLEDRVNALRAGKLTITE